MEPLRWISFLKRHEFQRDWEVDKIEVEIVDSEVLHGSLTGGLDVLFPVVGVPEFACDPHIFSLNEALIDGFLEPFTSFFLITVISSLIEAPVSSLDGLVGSLGTYVFAELPEAESDGGHLSSRV